MIAKELIDEASPLPWKHVQIGQRSSAPHEPDEWDPTWILIDANGDEVFGQGRDEDNDALIVHAVNALEPLVESGSDQLAEIKARLERATEGYLLKEAQAIADIHWLVERVEDLRAEVYAAHQRQVVNGWLVVGEGDCECDTCFEHRAALALANEPKGEGAFDAPKECAACWILTQGIPVVGELVHAGDCEKG